MRDKRGLVFRWVDLTMTIAVWNADPSLKGLDLANRVISEADRVVGRVRGNKRPGSRISPADKRLIFEGALRRALDLLEGAAVEAGDDDTAGGAGNQVVS